MNRTHGETHYDPDNCFGCRLRSIQFGKSTFTPHFNYAVGKYVTSQRDFESALQRLSARNSEQTGITHEYEPLHPSDIINNPPPESAPSHLAPLSSGDDPTDSQRRQLLMQERAATKEKAVVDAQTKDLINADV